MKQKQINEVMGWVLLTALVFGIIVPKLISASSTFAVILGIAFIIGFINLVVIRINRFNKQTKLQSEQK